MPKKKQIPLPLSSPIVGPNNNFNNLNQSTYTIPTKNGSFTYKGLPVYKSLNDSDALMNASQYKDKSFDPIAYLSNQIILNENNKPSVAFNKNSKQNWYNPFTNNLNIHDSKGVLAELSHSAQAKQKSVIAGIAGDWLQHPYVTPKGQKLQYHIPGTTEHEAHSVIEPQLKQRYMNVYDSLNKRKALGMPLFLNGGPDSELSINFDPNILGRMNQWPGQQPMGIQFDPNRLGNLDQFQPKPIGIQANPNILGSGNFDQQPMTISQKPYNNEHLTYTNMALDGMNMLAAFINNGKNNREERRKLQEGMQTPTWQATDDYRYGLNNNPILFERGGSANDYRYPVLNKEFMSFNPNSSNRPIVSSTAVHNQKPLSDNDNQYIKMMAQNNKATAYHPSKATLRTKAGLAGASYSPNPIIKALSIGALTGGDLATSINYAADGQWGNAALDFGQAFLNLIPHTRQVGEGMKGEPIMKTLNWLKNMKKGSDIYTGYESFQNGGQYVVKRGDSLSKIAQQMGIPLQDLIKSNAIKNPNLIVPGTIIKNPTTKKAISQNSFMNMVVPTSSKKSTTKNALPKANASIQLGNGNPLLQQLQQQSGNDPVIMHYAEQMLNNGNKLFITDKGKKRIFYDDNGQIKTTPVLTGKNDNINATRYFTIDELEQRAETGKNPLMLKGAAYITPVGATGILKSQYESRNALEATNPAFRNIKFHPSHLAIEKQRNAALKSSTISDNAQTMGCINCEKPAIDRLAELFGNDYGNRTDSAYVVDSRLSLEGNQKAFNRNAPKPVKKSFLDNFKFERGGNVPRVPGLAPNDKRGNALVETGEAIEFNTGRYGLVDTEGVYNQDHGDSNDGTLLPGVNRVLENTSTKRKEIEDVILRLTPESVKELTGFEPKGHLSHAAAFDKAVDFHSVHADKIMKKNNALKLRNNLSMAEKNALDLNNVFGNMIPKQEDIFESLFQDQEQKKDFFGITDAGNNQYGGVPKFRNGKGTPLGKLRDELDILELKKEFSPTSENIKAYNSKLQEYNSLKAGVPVPTATTTKMKQPTANFMSQVLGKGTQPTRTSKVQSTNFMNQALGMAPISAKPGSNKVQVNPVTGLPTNIMATGAPEYGQFEPPYTEDTKPPAYGDQEYWNNVYGYSEQNMGMPPLNAVSSRPPHGQYQQFVTDKMPVQLLDAFKSGQMKLTLKHMDIAQKAGISPAQLSDAQLIEGYNDDNAGIRGIVTQKVDFENQADANEATRGYRSIDVNGQPQYVDNTMFDPNDQPLTYFSFNGPSNPQGNQTTDFIKSITGMNTFKPFEDKPVEPSVYKKPINPMAPAENKPKSNNVPLEWFDYLSPLNGLVNSMSRYPEDLFTADLNQIQSKQIDPTNQVNEITSQVRPAIKDLSNDSVGMAAKMQLLTNAGRAKADIISTADNTNSQILNNQIQYNAGIRDKQSVMDATANQDFANRVLQSKSKQDEQKQESIDAIGNMFSKNSQFNNMVDLLATPNFNLDPESMQVAWNGKSNPLIPSNTPINNQQFDALGFMKPQKKTQTNAQMLKIMQDPQMRALYQIMQAGAMGTGY